MGNKQIPKERRIKFFYVSSLSKEPLPIDLLCSLDVSQLEQLNK
jgi:hypothetical protein